MLDKNGVEIKSGDIVEITGAYFKIDNGLYFVTASPDDPSWSGRDHCLKKISRKGKISTAKYNTCFWPIGIFVSDHAKATAAHRWNKEHAQIEVKEPCEDMSQVIAYFQDKADEITQELRRLEYNWGEDHPGYQKQKAIRAHYEAVVRAVEAETARR